MTPAPLVAATLEFDAEGVAYSSRYGDRYHPRAGALQQARHVFLHGNGLPERWRGRSSFTILETGFGLGNNFLATLAAWRADAQRCERLHYLAVERHPFTRVDLARAHASSPLQGIAGELSAAWPPLTPDLHRLAFDAGRVQLLLAFGDVADWLPGIVARVDAFYLDGFAPARNPEMWQDRIFKSLARLATPSATAATWSVARAVRDGLTAAGFEVARAQGSGGKREITRARFAPRFVPRRPPARLAEPAAMGGARRAVIVGAGLAGCAVAHALAEQGWDSTLFERLPDAACATSGNRAGVFHGIFNPQDGVHARFNRTAALQAAESVRSAIVHNGVPGAISGVLRLAVDADAALMQAQIDRLGLPAAYVHALSAARASALAGLPLPGAAWHYPTGGWVAPAAYAVSLLQRAGALARLRTGVDVAALRPSAAGWQIVDASGAILDEAPVVVLCNAHEALRLLGMPCWPLQSVRGQTTELPSTTPGLRLPKLPLTGNGYVLPALPDGMAFFGATAQPGDAETALRWQDHDHNLAQLRRLTGSAVIDGATLGGRVGWRCSATDRLPVLGAVPDGAAPPGMRMEQPRFVPRLAGLYVFAALGSRGITWASFGARTLAALIAGSPCPVHASLLDAVDVGRFAARQARRDTPRA